jgi:hypothetical protein
MLLKRLLRRPSDRAGQQRRIPILAGSSQRDALISEPQKAIPTLPLLTFPTPPLATTRRARYPGVWPPRGPAFSGRHHGVRKRRVESCLALDVNELRRKGALTPGVAGILTWERSGDAQASVDFRADSGDLVLSYDDHNSVAPRAVEQHVELSSVPAAFGGARGYFLCPGVECGQRVSVLYFCGGVFR